MTESEKKKAHRNRSGSIASVVSKSDSQDLDVKDAKLFVGSGGDLKIDTMDGQTVTLKNIPSGTFLDWIRVKRVHSRGTTAGDIVAFY
jgi:ribosomal protein L2